MLDEVEFYPNYKLFLRKIIVPKDRSGDIRAGKSERSYWIGLE